jgi:hypothetical protein
VAKPEAKSQPGRPKRRWEDIKMNLKEAYKWSVSGEWGMDLSGSEM